MKIISEESGFGLIEVIVSMVVLAIILLGLAMFNISTIQTNQTRNNRRNALTLAQDKVEGFYSLSFDELDTLADAGTAETVTNAADLNNFSNMQRISNWNYVDEDDFDVIAASPPTDAIRITVTVSSTSASVINQFSPVVQQATRTDWE